MLANFETEGLGGLLESRVIDSQGVCAGEQARNFIEPGGVGNDFTLGAGFAGGDIHTRIGNGAMLGIENGSANVRVIALSMGGDQGDCKTKNNWHDFSDHGSP